jgi:predicted homoserine dehydrogenase-like protein
MIIVDSALERLERDGRPIRVGMIGAGFMAKGIALQVSQYTKGMRLVAISNRNVSKAAEAYTQAGVDDVHQVKDGAALDRVINSGGSAVTDDPMPLCRSDAIDAIVEVTGAVEFSAKVAMEAIRNKKHVVLMNAELDGTVGPILKVHAENAGVIVTNADGDQPGVILNLYRFVRGIGVRPVLCGNIKGLHDPYRNPTTQEGFAKQWGQNPYMVTSFADGTKISFEQAIVANATGMKVGRRGMFGPTVPAGTSIQEAVGWYPREVLLEGPGIVDYVVGASPNPGVFLLGTHDDPVQRHYLELYKLGAGPLYCFYTPYHLCHFEISNSIARAVLFSDAAIAPLGGPLVDVVTVAKTYLGRGTVLDRLGGYDLYGVAENSMVVARDGLLPIGLAEGCTVMRDVEKDALLTYADVSVPPGRLIDRLRQEQNKEFGV